MAKCDLSKLEQPSPEALDEDQFWNAVNDLEDHWTPQCLNDDRLTVVNKNSAKIAAKLMVQGKEAPSPEAIVRAALLRAAYYTEEVWEPLDKLLPFASEEMNKAAHTGQYEAAERIAITIRSLASDPAEVAAIIKKAGEDWG
jgi:hypothetical protein